MSDPFNFESSFYEYFNFTLPNLYAYLNVITDQENNIVGYCFQNSKTGRGNNKDMRESCIYDATYKKVLVDQYNNTNEQQLKIQCYYWRIGKEFNSWLKTATDEFRDMCTIDGKEVLRSWYLRKDITEIKEMR